MKRQQRWTSRWVKRGMVTSGLVGMILLMGSSGWAQLFNTDVAVTTGDTPAVMLNQDNSALLGVQNWTLAGDEISFRLDDDTNLQNPFVIYSGAPDNSLTITSNGRVGLRTDSPEGSLHIYGLTNQDVFSGIGPDPAGDSNTGALNFGYAGSSFGIGSAFFNVRPVTAAVPPNPSLRFATSNVQRMIITNIGRVGIGNVAPTQQLDVTGNIRASGSFISGATTLNVPDYVFEPGYQLRPLSELAVYIEKERHLPEMPSAAMIKAEGVNLSEFQMQLLKKIEELTLYTLEQEKTNRAQAEIIAQHQATIGTLSTELRLTVDTLTDRLQVLEQQQTASRRNGQ